MHDALVRKAQEKAAADVESFKQSQRRTVAAAVDTQRAEKERADAQNAAVRRARRTEARLATRRGVLTPSCMLLPQAYKQPNMSPQFLDAFGRSAR